MTHRPDPTARGASPRGANAARLSLVLVLALLLAGSAVVAPRATRAATSGASYDWPQFDGNAQHSGDNTREAILSAANVGGLRLAHTASLASTEDGAPAYLSGVATANGTQDLLFLTSSDGRILALDAHTLAQVWERQYGPGACHINNGSSACYTTSSPAVDPNRQYVYSYGLDGYVHKYAVGSGAEVKAGGWPEQVTTKSFDEKESSALSVATAHNGMSYLYVAQAGYPGDNGDYQGHVTTINLADGSQRVFNANCSEQAAHFVERPGAPDCAQVQTAVWSRAGVVYDGDNDRVYFSTGNGPFDANSASAPNHDWGDTVLALGADGTGANGKPLDSYTPGNYQTLRSNDADIGSTSPAILPVPAASAVRRLGLQSGKDSVLRLLNLDNLSGQGGPGHTDGQVGQLVPVPQGGEVLPTPAVWVNPSDGSTWVFVANYNGLAGLQLTVDGGGTPSLQTRWQNTNGGTSAIVANNVLYYASYGALKALDPTTGKALWQDTSIGSIHWESPIVANGALYLTTGSTNSSGALREYTLPASVSVTTTPAATAIATAALPTATATPPRATTTNTPQSSPTTTDTPQSSPTTTDTPQSSPTTTDTATALPPAATASATPRPSGTASSQPATPILTPTPRVATATATTAPSTATATATDSSGPPQSTTTSTATPIPPAATSTATGATPPVQTGTPAQGRPTATMTRKAPGLGFGLLAPGYNNAGITRDHKRAATSLDAGYASYSAQALQAAGLGRGATITYDGLPFRWPNVAPGLKDNVVARGQTVALSAPSRGSMLALLGAATNGPSGGQLIVRYADGSTQSLTLGFADWTLNGGRVKKSSYANAVVAAMPYRNRTNGTKQVQKTYVFYAAATLRAGKTVTSVTLPAKVNHGLLHVFALTVSTPAGHRSQRPPVCSAARSQGAGASARCGQSNLTHVAATSHAAKPQPHASSKKGGSRAAHRGNR